MKNILKISALLLVFPLYAQEDHFQNELFIYYKPDEVANYGLPHSILEKHELEKNPANNIAKTLQDLPGVSQSYFSGGANRPIIRGATGERIRILENSLGVADVSGVSDDHQVMSDPIEATEFSVLRGPATLFYGSNASGGLVQLRNASISRNPVEREFAGQLDLRTATVDNEKTGALKLFGQAGNNNWYISGYNRDTDAYNSPIGIQENTQSSSQGITIGNSYIWDKGFFGLALSHREARYGIPEASHGEHEDGHSEDEHEHEEGVYLDPKMDQIDLVYHRDNPFKYFESFESSFRATDYKHNENEEGLVATTYKNNSQELRFDLTQKKIKKLDGGIGINIRNSDFKASGEEAFIPSSSTIASGIYSFEQLDLNSTLLQFGLNQEVQQLSPDSYSNKNFNLTSLSAGVIYPLSDSYSINYFSTYTERAPSAGELFSNGLHLARSSFEIGDQGLPEEKSINHEIGIAKKLGRLQSQLNIFYRNYSDYIALNRTGEQEEGFDVYKYSSVPAHFYGFEFSNKYNVFSSNLGNLDFSLSNDLLRARDESTKKELPKTPPVKTVLALDYDKERVHLGIKQVIQSSQEHLSDNETKTNAYHSLNASAGYDLDPAEKISLFLEGNNLTNEEIRLHTSFTRDLLVLPGRTVLFGIKAKF